MLFHLAFLQPQAQSTDDFGGMLVFADDVIKNFAKLGDVDAAIGEHSLCSLRVTEDGAKRSVKLVRKRTGEFAQRRYPR